MRLDTIGVFGAGTTGKGIIRALAGSGVNVIFCEVSHEKVDSTIEEISERLDYEISRWGVTEGEKRLIMSRIKGTSDMKDLADCQVIIEAIPGDLDEKKRFFHQLDEFFPPDTVLISNSPTLCVSDLAQRVNHPGRIISMHFSYPVHSRPIVEIASGRYTSERTMRIARSLARTMKKTAIEVSEMPGQITTRIMVPYVNEAIQIVMEGLATPEQVDLAMRLSFRLPLGPLALADELGLDSMCLIMDRLFKELGDMKYRPNPLLKRMVREGKLGVKSGEGFFQYGKNGEALKEPEKES